MSNLSDMNMSAEQLADSDAGAGWNLIVPAKAKASRKSAVARWLEIVKVTNAYREDEIGKQNQLRLLLVAEYDVLTGGDSEENVGRSGSIRLRLNPQFVNGKNQQALGQGNAQGETTMHAMSMKKFKQLLVASGIGLAGGMSAEVVEALFPLTNGSVLVGKTLSLIMEDNESKKYNGENSQEAGTILAGPQGA